MTFTALFTYKGHQFVRQIDADDATAASRVWGKVIQAGNLKDKTEKAEAIPAPEAIGAVTEADVPVALKGMSGVYTQVLTFSGPEDYGVLTLVKTQNGRYDVYDPIAEVES